LGTKSCRSRSRRQLSIEKIDPGRVAARPGEAGDKTKPDRVIADTKDDRDRRGCSFGRQCGQIASRGDHGHLSANQVGHLRRQAIVLALQPVVLDCHVLAFDGAGFVEAFAERGRIARVGIGRSVSDKPDHRHRRLHIELATISQRVVQLFHNPPALANAVGVREPIRSLLGGYRAERKRRGCGR
jgi:hypothetical protein